MILKARERMAGCVILKVMSRMLSLPCVCAILLLAHCLVTAAKANAAGSREESLVEHGEALNENETSQGRKAERKGAFCMSQGGRFDPFRLAGHAPRKAPKGGRDDLTFCRVYKSKTCCGRSQSDSALISVRMLAVGGEASDECLAVWEALECAICDPAIGTQRGPPAICSTYCDRVYSACRNAFFANDRLTQTLTPCGPHDTVCSRAREWTDSGSSFCQMAGFHVVANNTKSKSGDDLDSLRSGAPEALRCFDGKPVLGLPEFDSGDDTEGKWGSRRRQKQRSSSGKSFWQQFVAGLELGENIQWVIAGLVLTGGGGYLRWRAARARRKRAAVFASRSLAETRAKQQAAYGRGPKSPR
eukprot:jgi/Mesen1/1604/ME000134S00720